MVATGVEPAIARLRGARASIAPRYQGGDGRARTDNRWNRTPERFPITPHPLANSRGETRTLMGRINSALPYQLGYPRTTEERGLEPLVGRTNYGVADRCLTAPPLFHGWVMEDSNLRSPKGTANLQSAAVVAVPITRKDMGLSFPFCQLC